MHDSNDPFFYQSGLNDNDIAVLLKLVRAQTNEKILSIVSEKDDAVIMTGILSGPLAGGGTKFNCQRTKDGWQILNSGEWIS